MTVGAAPQAPPELAHEAAPAADVPLPDSPYRGLVPYGEDDAPFFFGRAAEQELIEANLAATRLTVLYAGSGVGKTSVLRAGVARHVRDEARANLTRRGRPKLIPVVFSSWGGDPVAGLAAAVRDGVEGVYGAAAPPVDVTSHASLADMLDAYAERARGDLLVILDQFEEYFLYHARDPAGRRFADELARAVNRPGLRANFLVAIREDSLAKLDRFKAEIPALFENYLRLEDLDRDEARRAIELPIAKFNSLLPADTPQIEIEPQLVKDVLDQVQTGRLMLEAAGRGVVDAADAADADSIEAPFLQLVMTRLWNEEKCAWKQGRGPFLLRAQTLRRLAGAAEIAKTHLDTVMGDELTAKERAAAGSVFHHLVTPSGAKIAHRPSDLAEYARLPRPEVESLLKKLAGSDVRVLRPIAPPAGQQGEPRYEIFHDVLGPAILDWRARQLERQTRLAVVVWVVAALMGVVTLSIPIGSLVVAAVMRRVRPPYSWKRVFAVLLAWWIGWLVGALVAYGIAPHLWPKMYAGEDDWATGVAIILTGAALGPLLALGVFLLLHTRSREAG